MASDADERTTALGLFNTARSYWRSAEYLNTANLQLTHPHAPVTFLYCHAIELYLKALLRGLGKSVADLKKLGHDVASLARAAAEAGLQLNSEIAEILSHIDDADVAIEARYIVTGFKERLPTNDALSKVSESLDHAVGTKLSQAGFSIRKESFEAPAPQRAGGLGHDTERVLLHMFKADNMDDRDLGIMARRLEMEKGVMQCHLDRLQEAGFADISGSHPDFDEVYWYVLPNGRRYVVEQKLI
jgi:HEPN domain-containing protein